MSRKIREVGVKIILFERSGRSLDFIRQVGLFHLSAFCVKFPEDFIFQQIKETKCVAFIRENYLPLVIDRWFV